MPRKYDIEINGSRIKFDEDLQNLYSELNKKWFGFKLPYVRCGWSASRKDKRRFYGCTLRIHGSAHCHYIQINPLFRDWPDTISVTLLHEMVHVKLSNRGGHGPKFKKEMRRLIRLGAFDPYL